MTHTFVTGEVRGLRATGVRVETATVRRVPPTEALSQADREEWERTWAIVPPRPLRLLRSHIRALRRPRAYFSTLWQAMRSAHAGGRARLWQLFYFAEAILLWDWMSERGVRHIHVHHANVSADVALLACAYANRANAEPPWTWSITIHGPTELLDVAAHKLAAKVADAAAVVCISDFARSQVAALADPAHSRRSTTVHCGVDLGAFAPRGERGGGDGIVADPLRGRALAPQGPCRAARGARSRLRERSARARLTLAGDGAERAVPRAQAQPNWASATAVEFLGAVEPRPDGRALRGRADVFCLPSFAEGVPVVLMEAMAMEIPVVATEIMGVPELVEHEVSGLLVPPARPDLLADALVRLLGDPELRRRMGAAGRDRVAADYDGAKSAAQLERILAPFIA